ncbi:hypothetical protein V6N13_063318 [Hibiscus sabdariffa]|uniref:Uncharacterized protein n=2 Tax=Hibiscus sabdariffa TaxID=183260 RepID=A0ABR1ZFK5_9ROSI
METSINISGTNGKAPLSTSSKAFAVAVQHPRRGVKKGIAIGDFIIRLCAMAATMGAAITVGLADQSLPFFTQFLRFQAKYDDIPSLVFFMVANAIVTGYLVLSLPFSVICIIRPLATTPRLLLVIFDAAMAGLTMAAGSASASIIYLAHNGNPNTNWLPFCQQFGDFCQAVSGAVVGSLIAGTLLLFLLILSAFALKRS